MLFFFICNKNGNKLYFCSRVRAVCLSSCLPPARGGCCVAGVWGHGDRETGHGGTGSFPPWLLAPAQQHPARVKTSTPGPPAPATWHKPPEGREGPVGWPGAAARLPGGGSFLLHPAALLGQEPIPRKRQSRPRRQRRAEGSSLGPRGTALRHHVRTRRQLVWGLTPNAGSAEHPRPGQGWPGRVSAGVTSARGFCCGSGADLGAVPSPQALGLVAVAGGGGGRAQPSLFCCCREGNLLQSCPGTRLEPSRSHHDGTGLPAVRKATWMDKRMCPSETSRARRPEHLPSPWQAPTAIPSRPTASPRSPVGVWRLRAVPAFPGLHQPRFLPLALCSRPVTASIPALRSAPPRRRRSRAPTGARGSLFLPSPNFPAPGRGQA